MANVLPIENQKDSQRRQVVRFTLVFAEVMIGCALVAFIVLLPSYLALHIGLQQATSGVASTTTEQLMIRNTKATIAQINAAVAATTTPSTLLQAILAAKPAGVSITSIIYMGGQSGKIVVSANSGHADLIQTFRTTLQADSHFNAVSIPVSALVASTNGDFTVTLTGAF
jgi:hypothetical protein